MEKPPALALPILRMVSEMASAEPAPVDAGAPRLVTVRSGSGEDVAVTTASKLLRVTLFPVLTSPFPFDGLMLLIRRIPVVPTDNQLGSGNDTVCVIVCHGPRAGMAT